MTLPCVVGRDLAAAERLLAEAGVGEVMVARTAPPRGRGPTGAWRVVRQRPTERGVALLIAATLPLPEGDDSDDGSD